MNEPARPVRTALGAAFAAATLVCAFAPPALGATTDWTDPVAVANMRDTYVTVSALSDGTVISSLLGSADGGVGPARIRETGPDGDITDTSFGDATALRVLVPASGNGLLAVGRRDGLDLFGRVPGGLFERLPAESGAGIPDMAANQAGAAVALVAGEGETQQAVRFRVPGGTFGPPVPVARLGYDASTPVVALTSAGETIVAWIDGRWGEEAKIRVAIGTAAGFAPPATVATAPGGASSLLLAADDNGGAALAWSEVRSDPARHVWATSTRPPGGAFRPSRDLMTSTYWTNVTLAAGGSRAAISVDSSGSRPILAFADLATGGFSSPQPLNGISGNGVVDVSPEGRILVVGAGGGGNVKAAWDDGHGNFGPVRYVSCVDGGLALVDQVSAASGGHAALVGWGVDERRYVSRTDPGHMRTAPNCPEPSVVQEAPRPEAARVPFVLSIPKKLKLDRKGRISIKISAPYGATATFRGHLTLKGLRSRLTLKPVRRNVIPGLAGWPPEKVVIGVSGREAMLLTRKYRRGGKLRLNVSARAIMGPNSNRLWTDSKLLKLAGSR